MQISFSETYMIFNLDLILNRALYRTVKNKASSKLKDSMIVPANGRPAEVKVGYRTIRIKYVRPDFIMDDMTDSYGEYRAREGVIYIQDSLVPQERCNTTWHEILHAVVYIFSLNQANGPLKEDDAEELVVNTISNAMMGVYRDNPWLLDMLKENLNSID